ncbi:hypothetical protein L249_8001, partial [Ophiocordyceps polyrhachis-furcata BCC 54312]
CENGPRTKEEDDDDDERTMGERSNGSELPDCIYDYDYDYDYDYFCSSLHFSWPRGRQIGRRR